ncbi:MAG: Mut7-C RNAse domain-containing protein [Chloroflexota bacterium]|nr:Mut7-C RNAse domain-containing protein [Chloroflexota bacterium]
MSYDDARPKFIVDANVGKLARWLRMLGYDTIFDRNLDDGELVAKGLRDGRVLLTRDTRIMLRRAVTSGELRAMLTPEDNPVDQMRRVIAEMKLDRDREFTLCLECNEPLVPRRKDEVGNLVPPYVFKTQSQYFQCSRCERIYWRGTHWQHMREVLENLTGVER